MLTAFSIFASGLKNKYQNYYRMKKIIFAALLLAFPLVASAQNRVEVSYESPDSIPDVTRGLMEFLDVYYMKITVHGDIKGKKWILWANQSNDGKVTSKPVFPYTFEFADTTATFSFYAQADKTDSASIRIVTPRFTTAKNKYAINAENGTPYNSQYILMETLPEKPYDTTQDIPLVAFTTGLVKEVTYEGKKGVSIDYCGLRFANTDPKLWQEKHKVPRFVYFSLRME